MKHLGIFLIVLLTASLLACGQQDSTTRIYDADWFSFSYPGDWRVDETARDIGQTPGRL